MSRLLVLTFVAIFAVMAGTEAQSQPLAYKVFPHIVVSNLTEKLSIDCRATSAITDFKRFVLMDIFRENENGTKMVANLWSKVKVQEDGRTKGEGQYQSEENAQPTYMSVTVQNPTFEDEGTYSCRFIYLNTGYQLKQIKSSVNVTVEAIPPPDYVPSLPSSPADSCDCNGVWSEINKLKGMVENKEDGAVEGAAPAPVGVPGDASCQVSFSAHFKTQNGQPIMSDQHLIFNDVVSNKGEAYSTETGLFSVPCDGQYFFTLSLRTRQEMDSGYVDGLIMADDEEMARTSVFVDAPINNIESATNGVVLSLKQGQKVKVMIKTTSFGQIVGSTYSIFSGFFLFH